MEPNPNTTEDAPERPHRHFIQQEIDRDLAEGRTQTVRTRFPPEPNGYLHVGHAKAICVDFGLAREFGGTCNLRFDDTNPTKEETEYVLAIQEDVKWLGFDWGERLTFSSGFFDELYGFAEHLVQNGDAYVDDQAVETIREGRGGPGRPGVNAPNRDTSPADNLAKLRGMRDGEFAAGSCVLRAKIDMAHANLLMRDPVLYRILDAPHHRTGDTWRIYPTYDMAHGQCDALEGISHSLCSLEFENHRPLYDWLIQRLPIENPPRQIEFARLNLGYTILSKRKLIELVDGGHVEGWDDPRLPTLRGMRRRGYTPASIRNLCERVGLAKFNSLIELSWLEDSLRHDLNQNALRRMAVLDPLKVVITNLAEGESIERNAVNNPEAEDAGTRPFHLTREIWIERDDFQLEAPKKFFRLKPDGYARLKYGFIIHCEEVVQDADGHVTELRCTYLPDSADGQTPEGMKKVKGIIHWVSAADAVDAEVRLYEPLFSAEVPGADDRDWLDDLNPDSKQVRMGCKLEPALAHASPGESFQFERLGYFCADRTTSATAPVFHRAVTLRDSWAKVKDPRPVKS